MEFVSAERCRLDRFLAGALPAESRTRLAKWITEGHVRVDGRVEKPSFVVLPGMRVAVETLEPTEAHDLTPADIPLDVLFEDDHLLVVNKPRGMATHPAASLKEPSLVNALLGRGGALSEGSATYRPGIVHRLDKETTGLLVIAKTDAAHRSLAKQIEEKTAHRVYLAIVGGDLPLPPAPSPRHGAFAERGSSEFTIDAPIARDKRNRQKMAVDPQGKRAVTHVRVVRKVDAGTLLECRLETGRTHQIRVHLRSIGLPVVGDTVYAPKEFHTAPLQLHAWKLAFEHPASHEWMEFEADPPTDFLAIKRRTGEDWESTTFADVR